MALTLTTTAFSHESHEGEIPDSCAKKGGNLSPVLRWNSVPAETVSLALIVTNPTLLRVCLLIGSSMELTHQ